MAIKRDEIEGNNNLSVDHDHIPNNSSSYKYKLSLITSYLFLIYLSLTTLGS